MSFYQTKTFHHVSVSKDTS